MIKDDDMVMMMIYCNTTIDTIWTVLQITTTNINDNYVNEKKIMGI